MKAAALLPLFIAFTLSANGLNWVTHESTTHESATQEGRDLGKWTRKEAFGHGQTIDPEHLIPLDQRGQIFDSEIAKAKTLSEEHPDSDVLDYLRSKAVASNEERTQLSENDPLFIQAELATMTTDPNTDEENTASGRPLVTEHTERCLESDGPAEIKLTRTLDVEVHVKPAVLGEVRLCKGHGQEESHWKKENAQKAKERLSNELSEDPSIKDFKVEIVRGGKLAHYHVKCDYCHHDNDDTCDDYEIEIQTIKEEEAMEVDHWQTSDEKLWSLASSPDLTLASRRCVNDEPTRIINGKEVTRKCWKEEFTFLGPPQEGRAPSPLWHDPLCKHIGKRCLTEGPLGCALWEHSFLCQRTRPTLSLGETEALDAFSLDDDIDEDSTTSLPKAVTTLAVFSEMKDEIETSEAFDPSTLQLFKGNRFTCGKSIATDLLYDCCFSYQGLAKTLHLAHCNADELALADRRERKLCHYIGKYEDDFLGLWKSRDVHVFCCFPSKLARALQEGARDQLNIGWGTPENPLCRGLYTDEISKLDLSVVDLSDAYEIPTSPYSDNLKGKMEELAERVRQRVQRLQGEASHVDI